MILYILFRIGYFISNALSLNAAYWVACLVADIHYNFSRRDREAVMNNLRIITGDMPGDKELRTMANEVFRNFARYLVDFFRFSRINDEYIKKNVRITGLENVDKGLSAGKGVIVLSAHIGNWELGAQVLSMMRPPMKAVVLTHRNKLVNDFFTKQRTVGDLKPVEIGISLRNCYKILKSNGILAMLGDRDFSKNGLCLKFFGKGTLIPKGPAVFSHRLGSCIVPCFIVRVRNNTFRFIFEPPIYPEESINEYSCVKSLAEKYTSTIESYVKKYPTQWYMFREAWNGD